MLHDARLALPPDNIFRYLSPNIAPLPANLREPLLLRTASEIQAERLSRK